MKLSNSQRRTIGSGDWLFEDETLWDLESPTLYRIKEFIISQFLGITEFTQHQNT